MTLSKFFDRIIEKQKIKQTEEIENILNEPIKMDSFGLCCSMIKERNKIDDTIKERAKDLIENPNDKKIIQDLYQLSARFADLDSLIFKELYLIETPNFFKRLFIRITQIIQPIPKV